MNRSSERRTLAVVATIAFTLMACSSGTTASSSDKCASIAQSIRDAAAKPRPPNFPNGYDGDGDGVADAKGICESKDPTIVKDFGAACATFRNDGCAGDP